MRGMHKETCLCGVWKMCWVCGIHYGYAKFARTVLDLRGMGGGMDQINRNPVSAPTLQQFVRQSVMSYNPGKASIFALFIGKKYLVIHLAIK